MSSTSTLTSKGQLTLPKSIRDFLGVEIGDKIEFVIDVEGHVLLSPKTLSIDDIFCMIDKRKGVSIEDMDEAIGNAIEEKHNPEKFSSKGDESAKRI